MLRPYLRIRPAEWVQTRLERSHRQHLLLLFSICPSSNFHFPFFPPSCGSHQSIPGTARWWWSIPRAGALAVGAGARVPDGFVRHFDDVGFLAWEAERGPVGGLGVGRDLSSWESGRSRSNGSAEISIRATEPGRIWRRLFLCGREGLPVGGWCVCGGAWGVVWLVIEPGEAYRWSVGDSVRAELRHSDLLRGKVLAGTGGGPLLAQQLACLDLTGQSGIFAPAISKHHLACCHTVCCFRAIIVCSWWLFILCQIAARLQPELH